MKIQDTIFLTIEKSTDDNIPVLYFPSLLIKTVKRLKLISPSEK